MKIDTQINEMLKKVTKKHKNNTKIFDFLKICGYNCETKQN